MPTSEAPIEELGIYLLPGRVTDPSRAIDEAAEAEALGLTSAWIAERFDMKELGVLCGAVAARTERIKVGMGSVAVATRNPLVTAAMGATMVQAFGNRLLLGLARGLWGINENAGMASPTMAAFEDYARIMVQLWNGETVHYDGPAGRFSGMKMPDPPGSRPPIVLSSWAPQAKATALTARLFDGVFIGCELTVEATANICGRLRAACEQIGRDPASLTIYNTMMVAPDLTPDEELAQINARMVTHFSFPGIGDLLVKENGWDPEPMRRLLATGQMQGDRIADQAFRRDQLLELGAGLPREWVETGCAVGTAAEVAGRLRDYVDAGLDHLVLHAASPGQLAGVVKVWREGA
ncbi:MAG: TIGR03857 family LLM class F420-dependent oxidoreductase [Acidimicrobiia bacterium]